ncbi:unnamed protein product [Arabidopsis lyrata]|uniref:Predicted protein n=1 Tax=Arabidopsis lyrata subsp. lyrata TaxID=81972 RepID=D7L5B1_ARALL|nr:predicted protein [Arabidopsis lyrata subsp. lyrata]CAH8262827.1 unnamed protein product [Arabidopsis lyrata]
MPSSEAVLLLGRTTLLVPASFSLCSFSPQKSGSSGSGVYCGGSEIMSSTTLNGLLLQLFSSWWIVICTTSSLPEDFGGVGVI